MAKVPVERKFTSPLSYGGHTSDMQAVQEEIERCAVWPPLEPDAQYGRTRDSLAARYMSGGFQDFRISGWVSPTTVDQSQADINQRLLAIFDRDNDTSEMDTYATPEYLGRLEAAICTLVKHSKPIAKSSAAGMMFFKSDDGLLLVLSSETSSTKIAKFTFGWS